MTDLLLEIRNKIVDLLTGLGLNSWKSVIIVMFLLALDGFLLYKKDKAKRMYLVDMDETLSEEDASYIYYYKKKQYIQTIRGIMRAIVLLSFILYHNPNAFAGLAIAIGAFVIIFGSIFLSLGVYLYLISFYSPGMSVKIGEEMGEIVSITPLYLKIMGRNESGEHTGELINIPNNQVWQDKIKVLDLELSTIQKVILMIPYSFGLYGKSFEEFNTSLCSLLDETFPLNTLKNASHYKSYKGYRYKLDYSLTSDGQTQIHLGFLCKRSKVREYKMLLITRIEGCKQANKENNLTQESEINTNNK